MTELKTLKDIDTQIEGFYRDVDKVRVFKKELKQEAIKWVKGFSIFQIVLSLAIIIFLNS